jgi:hypothetical protein
MPDKADEKQVFIFEKIAEERIRQAMEDGAFDGLPGAGKPLKLDDDRMVPEELRMAARVLKNAGCVPPEVELHREIVSLRRLIDSLDDDAERILRIRELNFKILRFNMHRGRALNIEAFPEYEERLFTR